VASNCLQPTQNPVFIPLGHIGCAFVVSYARTSHVIAVTTIVFWRLMLQDFQERNNQMVGELGSIDASKQAQ
jgi:hypothetical protein